MRVRLCTCNRIDSCPSATAMTGSEGFSSGEGLERWRKGSLIVYMRSRDGGSKARSVERKCRQTEGQERIRGHGLWTAEVVSNRTTGGQRASHTQEVAALSFTL